MKQDLITNTQLLADNLLVQQVLEFCGQKIKSNFERPDFAESRSLQEPPGPKSLHGLIKILVCSVSVLIEGLQE